MTGAIAKSNGMAPLRASVAEFGTPWLVRSGQGTPTYCPQIVDTDESTSVALDAGDTLLVEWRQPRDIYSVSLLGDRLPGPDDVEIEYWYHVWPDNGGGGWQRVDDPFNGRWVKVKAESEVSEGRVTWTFSSLGKEENPDIEQTGFGFRRTYKVRLIFRAHADICEVETHTDSRWKEATIKLEWSPRSNARSAWTGRVEARNAHIVSVMPEGKTKEPVYVHVRYLDNPERLSPDRGYVVFRAGNRSFSVFVDDVVREGGIYVRDVDAFVSDASKDLSYSMWKRPADAWDGTVMEKVARLPEQSMENVARAIPMKPPREAHLGLPNMRQEFTITPSGNIQLLRDSLRSPGRDLDHRTWDDWALTYHLSTLETPVFTEDGGREVIRYLEDGYLPIIHADWKTQDISCAQSSFCTTLVDELGGIEEGRGDETLVLCSRITMQNTGDSEQTAFIWIESSRKDISRISPDGLLLCEGTPPKPAAETDTWVRGRLDTNGKGELSIVPQCTPAKPGSPDEKLKDSAEPRPALRYVVTLAPGEQSTLDIYLPYIDLLNPEELSALRTVRFDARYPELKAYWNKRIEEGMEYCVPEPVLNDLWKANLWHTLITTDRDPETGLYQHGAATMRYRTYANETGMVAESLEMRGEHDEAYRIIEPFLKCQGVKPLPGNFLSREGLLYAAHPVADPDPYTAQGYNMHHGWALWNLSRHYFWTRDAKWLWSVAPNLIKACDWVTRERQATKVLNPDGTKPIEWGLAPAGDLEDVEEYLYWYATNAYYYVGMKTAASALADIGHPEAARLARDARVYKADILASIRESVATTPVVKLKDGTWIPYVPPRAYVLTHRKEGWIREGLYPAIHLLDGEVLAPHHKFVTWILQDLEDNIFMSKESGYGVEDQLSNFFNFGGFNLQPNLCPNSYAHLRRDEIPHFLRVFYNECWASLYPDTVCFAEWVRYYGKGGGPLYKTPDECKFIQYMRQMLILEDGNVLKLGMGVPRAWMEDGKKLTVRRAATWFGSMDMEIVSSASEGRISATITMPTRNRPESVLLRLRHPEGKPMRRVTVNGRGWRQFSSARELITLPANLDTVEVVACY